MSKFGAVTSYKKSPKKFVFLLAKKNRVLKCQSFLQKLLKQTKLFNAETVFFQDNTVESSKATEQ